MPLVRISDPDLVPELVASLREAGCLATCVQGNACLVGLPFGDDLYLPIELTFFIKAWLHDRPAVTVDVVA
jgi:hypothetical protein